MRAPHSAPSPWWGGDPRRQLSARRWTIARPSARPAAPPARLPGPPAGDITRRASSPPCVAFFARRDLVAASDGGPRRSPSTGTPPSNSAAGECFAQRAGLLDLGTPKIPSCARGGCGAPRQPPRRRPERPPAGRRPTRDPARTQRVRAPRCRPHGGRLQGRAPHPAAWHRSPRPLITFISTPTARPPTPSQPLAAAPGRLLAASAPATVSRLGAPAT